MSTSDKIKWYEDYDEARKVASDSGKPVLLFFHYEHCAGCKKTIAETLPKMSVIDKIGDNFVAVMLDIEVAKDLVASYGVDWTPTFIVADSSGKEDTRWVGYLPEDDYLGMLDMGIAKHSFRKGDYKDAERLLDSVVIKYPLTELAPEACYYIGVARYRMTGDASWLYKAYANLKDMYPDSPWTLKSSAWSEIKVQKAA